MYDGIEMFIFFAGIILCCYDNCRAVESGWQIRGAILSVEDDAKAA